MQNNAIKLLKEAKNISIYSHINSDCDAMGSSLVLKLALEQLGKNVDVFSHSNFPYNFNFFGDLSFVNHSNCSKYDLAVCLDTPNENRLGKYKYTYRKGVKNTLCIDHHVVSNEQFCGVNVVETASSTCEILFDILSQLGINFTEDISKYLISGILTDTGRFSHSVSVHTLDVFSKLLASLKQTKIEDIVSSLFQSMQISTFEMLKKVYANMEFYAENKLAIVIFKHQDFIDANATLDDTDAFPDLALQLESVKIAILASEDDKGYFRVSFRSKGEYSARSVAETFGGGGHLNASGCKIFGEYEDVKQRLIDSVLATFGWKK